MARGRTTSCGSGLRVFARAAAFLLAWGILATSLTHPDQGSSTRRVVRTPQRAGIDLNASQAIESARQVARRLAQRLTS